MGIGLLLGRIYEFFRMAGPTLRSILIWAGVMTAHTVFMRTLWMSQFDRIDNLVTGYTAQSINFAPLSLMNTFFPLSEALTMVTAYATLVGVSASIRITKAFIDSKKT